MSNSDEFRPQAGSNHEARDGEMRVIGAAIALSGDGQKALVWYRSEKLAVFDYKTAEVLVNEGRSDDVVRYVHSLTSGAAG